MWSYDERCQRHWKNKQRSIKILWIKIQKLPLLLRYIRYKKIISQSCIYRILVVIFWYG
jgi:hypothetical protein